MSLKWHEFVTLQQCAALLGESRQTIYNRLKRGTAPKHERLGERYYFYRADVERLATRKDAGTA